MALASGAQVMLATPHAGLDQPSAQEHALAVDIPAVAVAGARVFAVDSNRLANRRRIEQVEGAGLKAIEVSETLVALEAGRATRQAARPAAWRSVQSSRVRRRGAAKARACRSRRRSGLSG